MSNLLEQTVLVEFADVLEEYTRRQRELLGSLREFRTAFLQTRPPPPPASLSVTQHRSPPVRHRPAPPTGVPFRPFVVPDPPTTPAAPSESWHDVVFGAAVHPTKRDYDYFTELDQSLERLRPRAVGP